MYQSLREPSSPWPNEAHRPQVPSTQGIRQQWRLLPTLRSYIASNRRHLHQAANKAILHQVSRLPGHPNRRQVVNLLKDHFYLFISFHYISPLRSEDHSWRTQVTCYVDFWLTSATTATATAAPSRAKSTAANSSASSSTSELRFGEAANYRNLTPYYTWHHATLWHCTTQTWPHHSVHQVLLPAEEFSSSHWVSPTATSLDSSPVPDW